MSRSGAAPDPSPPAGVVPEGTTELGIDIVKVERIRAAIDRFGERFSNRVLTPTERRYVRGRPETFAGRWAAKEAVSKVLGFGVRTAGGKYVFPLDIDDRLDDRERQLLARFERMRDLHERTRALAAEID